MDPPPQDITELPEELRPLAKLAQEAGGDVFVREVKEEGSDEVEVQHHLDLSNTQNTDQLVAEAKKYPSITHLYLTHSAVTDNGLKTAAELPNMTYINIAGEGMQVSDAGLEHLKTRRS